MMMVIRILIALGSTLLLASVCSGSPLFIHATNDNSADVYGYVHLGEVPTVSFHTVDAEMLTGAAWWRDGALIADGYGCFQQCQGAKLPMRVESHLGGATLWTIDGAFFRAFKGTTIAGLDNVSIPEPSSLLMWLSGVVFFVLVRAWRVSL